MAFPPTSHRSRPAFTLVELLTVLAIIMVLAGIVVAIKPGNPEGLAAAQRMSASVFQVAQSRALQAPNPDREPQTNPLYNVRARVLILNNPAMPDQHLRLMRIIIGGTRREGDLETASYFWYTMDADTLLPKGIYMVEPTESTIRATRRSHITNKDTGATTMRLNFEPTVLAQPEGSGDKDWYFYEFNSDGTSNMFYAKFVISEGEWDPGAKRVRFHNEQDIAGIWITPTGRTVFDTDPDEMEKAKQ